MKDPCVTLTYKSDEHGFKIKYNTITGGYAVIAGGDTVSEVDPRDIEDLIEEYRQTGKKVVSDGTAELDSFMRRGT